MTKLEECEQFIESIYTELNTIGNLGPNPEAGFLRAGYSEEETAAIKLIQREAEDLGMTVAFDAIGNFSAATASASGKYIEFASHLDTVPFGGNFDGAAGVVAGLAAIRSLIHSGIALRHGLKIRVWRLEEGSTFNAVCMGSRSAFGMSDRKVLDHVFSGQTLRQAIESQGYAPAIIAEKRATITQQEIDAILAHFELHIEQANVLEVEGKDIGIVTSIRGPRRTQITVQGRFDHSGGTPMGVSYRSDANLAIAYMQVRLNELFSHENGAAHDLVQTVGVVNSSRSINESDSRLYQNAPPKISGFGYFIFETRGAISPVRDSYHEKALALIRQTAHEFAVTVTVSELNSSDGIASLNSELLETLACACENQGVAWSNIASGAMHDAAIVASQKQSNGRAVPTAMIFIPCRDGISHSPDEFTSISAIAKGATVFAEASALLMKS